VKAIQLSILLLSITAASYAGREPFWYSGRIAAGFDDAVLKIVTVPEGKRLMLLRITADGNYEYVAWSIGLTGIRQYSWLEHIMFLEAGKVLSVQLPRGMSSRKSQVTVQGYLVDKCPDSDLNGDCRVDLKDFALMASEWLTCGLDIQEACWQ